MFRCTGLRTDFSEKLIAKHNHCHLGESEVSHMLFHTRQSQVCYSIFLSKLVYNKCEERVESFLRFISVHVSIDYKGPEGQKVVGNFSNGDKVNRQKKPFH